MKSFEILLHEAINVSDNPNFWKWFGKSKVIDSSGQPLVVYHGTQNVFSKFNSWPIYFTCNPSVASEYSYHGYGDQKQPNVIAAYLKMENPKILGETEVDEIIGPAGERDWSALEWYAEEECEKKGYDGIKLVNVYDFSGMVDGTAQRSKYDQYIVFQPSQIKSAIGNNGNYDPNDPDITH